MPPVNPDLRAVVLPPALQLLAQHHYIALRGGAVFTDPQMRAQRATLEHIQVAVFTRVNERVALLAGVKQRESHGTGVGFGFRWSLDAKYQFFLHCTQKNILS